jgi:hypothetical protein
MVGTTGFESLAVSPIIKGSDDTRTQRLIQETDIPILATLFPNWDSLDENQKQAIYAIIRAGIKAQ